MRLGFSTSAAEPAARLSSLKFSLQPGRSGKIQRPMIRKAEELAAMFERNFEQRDFDAPGEVRAAHRQYETVDRHSKFQIGIKV